MPKTKTIQENIDVTNFDDANLPTDVHVVAFKNEQGLVQHDAVRAYTMVDIFDEYYDKLKNKGEVISITSGYGRVRPNLYGKIKDD
jgi:hypothetical protein